MTQKPDPSSLPPAQTLPPSEQLPDHVFLRMKKMLANSIYNLPTPLVVIAVLSLTVAILTGLALKFVTTTSGDPFLPQRLSADETAPSIDPAGLQGSWVYTQDGRTMMITFRGSSFEWIIKPAGDGFERSFARGNFKTNGNIMVLGTRADMGQPEGTMENGLDFHPVDLHNLNLKLETNGKLMVWVIPASERNRMDTDFLRLFPIGANKPMTWVRMGSQ